MSKLSKSIASAMLADAVAQAEVYAGVYRPLATTLALNIAAAENSKGKVWSGFRDAISLALEAGHTTGALRAGLEIACIAAEIPAGTFRGYIGTVGNLHADVVAGNLDAETAAVISVADARKRYQKEKVLTDAEKLQKHIADGIKDWTAEQLALLASIVDDMQPEVEAEESGDDTADGHETAEPEAQAA